MKTEFFVTLPFHPLPYKIKTSSSSSMFRAKAISRALRDTRAGFDYSIADGEGMEIEL
jgi:hypothetical protein